MTKHITFGKVLAHANYYFDKKEISKGQFLLKEGEESNRIYIIHSGQVSLYKKMPSSNNLTDKNLFKAYKILDLGKGDIFGEDKQFFNCPNRFTIKVTSIKTTILSISCANLAKYFNRVWEQMLE